MEFVILGLLQLKSMTSYEILNCIKTSMPRICSDSAGSVQTALKKLIALGCIVFNEQVENGRNKKIFSITDQGKTSFAAWVTSPMDSLKVKNMELAKLFFLGMADAKSRKAAIVAYIEQMKAQLERLLALKTSSDTVSYESMWSDNGYLAKDLTTFQLHTLQYGIDSTKHEIAWYQKLLDKMITDNAR
jgi:PadR family transcriptional regulator AphA